MKVISVENVSKKFVLAHQRPSNLAEAARSIFSRGCREDFWALKDVSFEVEQGEAVGIIGHNGAGKSTMLKMLTKIMQPTSGRIRTRGRISALIEVGAGFHPEMTGRENIYLNGSILGMTRQEIASKFDDMVSFAELEKFIDTPVKRYSSGMYARLGFAVAAHVDPDILIVDEVLSVGDVAFQGKCTDWMRALRGAGVTVVLVSHNFGAVASVCDRAIGLWRGQVFADSAPAVVSGLYKEQMRKEATLSGGRQSLAGGGAADSDLRITDVEPLLPVAGKWEGFTNSPWGLRIHYFARTEVRNPVFSVRITRADGVIIAEPATLDFPTDNILIGDGCADFHAPCLTLQPASYVVETNIWDRQGVTAYDHGQFVFALEVGLNPDPDACNSVSDVGVTIMPGHWTCLPAETASPVTRGKHA